MSRGLDRMKITPIVLAGGLGTRLAPMSTIECPKQFLLLFHDKYSLFQLTIRRVRKIFTTETILICCNELHLKIIEKQLNDIDEYNYTLLVEKWCNNTFGSVLFGLKIASMIRANTLFVAPSDSYIENENEFVKNIRSAIRHSCATFKHMIFGVQPSYASDKYGYIYIKGCAKNTEDDRFYNVNGFKEKPDINTAQKFLKSGLYYWNSGYFVFNVDVLAREIQQFEPAMYEIFHSLSVFKIDDNKYCIKNDFYKIPNKQIDIAIVEKSKNLSCCLVSFDWCDVGSFEVLLQLLHRGKISVPKQYYALILSNKDRIVKSNL